MVAKALGICRAVDALSEWSGRMVSYVMILIVGIIVWDVTARYVLRSPLLWGSEMCNILFGFYFLIGGAYTMRLQAHVNVDIVVSQLSPKARDRLDIVGFVFLLFFAVLMIWQGSVMAWDAIMVMEKSASAWGAPIFLVKPFIPIGAFLLLIQGAANLLIRPHRLTAKTA